ncbi:MAG TPA: DNA recombination protein RmuC, partial [Stellaceae bacterium]|nr:DNA recombination protein RmuC [Stellaceae bacterium]
MDGLALMLAMLLGVLVGALIGGVMVGRGSAERARQLQAEFDLLRKELADMREARARAETEAALARQAADHAQAAIADWEKTRDEFLKSTQATVLTTAQQLSSKLLEDHKRETEAAKAAAEQQIKATTEALNRQVREVSDGISQLKGQVAEKAQVLDVVWRALSSPGGAGYFAEIGLANTLKSFGLVQERDFVLQATVQDSDGRKRPDAIVFLPADSVLVIDSKASK